MNVVGVQIKHKQSDQSRSAFSTLESVIRQAESLSPTERLSLWQHLAQLPESGIESTPDVRPLIRDHWMCLKTTSTSPPQDQEWEQLGFFGLQRKGNTVIATIDGVEVLRVRFKPKVFAEHSRGTRARQSGLHDGEKNYQVTLQEKGYDGQSKSSWLPSLRSG